MKLEMFCTQRQQRLFGDSMYFELNIMYENSIIKGIEHQNVGAYHIPINDY